MLARQRATGAPELQALASWKRTAHSSATTVPMTRWHPRLREPNRGSTGHRWPAGGCRGRQQERPSGANRCASKEQRTAHCQSHEKRCKPPAARFILRVGRSGTLGCHGHTTAASADVTRHLTATRVTGLHETADGCVLSSQDHCIGFIDAWPYPISACRFLFVFALVPLSALPGTQFGRIRNPFRLAAGEATVSAGTRRSAGSLPSHMSLTLEFIGTGDAFGSGGRFDPLPCLVGSIRLLIDCGATSPVALRQRSIAPPWLTRVDLASARRPFRWCALSAARRRVQPSARDASSDRRSARCRAARRGYAGAAFPARVAVCSRAWNPSSSSCPRAAAQQSTGSR